MPARPNAKAPGDVLWGLFAALFAVPVIKIFTEGIRQYT